MLVETGSDEQGDEDDAVDRGEVDVDEGDVDVPQPPPPPLLLKLLVAKV